MVLEASSRLADLGRLERFGLGAFLVTLTVVRGFVNPAGGRALLGMEVAAGAACERLVLRLVTFS